MNVSEISIPVPWGHIAGKTWGDKSHPPVLCLHGIMDNCNSFDRLIPLLPSCFFYVCLDFPGHGLSSHYPAGFLNNSFMFVSSVIRSVNYLGLDQCVLMCHSFGAQIGSMYASLFSDKVTKLIFLDSLGYYYVNSLPSARNLFEQSLLLPFKVEHNLATKAQPKYQYEDLLQRLIAGRSRQESSLTIEAAEILLKRNIQKVSNENLYYYTVDQHLKHYDNFTPTVTLEQLKFIYTSGIKCKVLILLSSESYKKQNSEIWLDSKSVWKKIGATIHKVEGNHDVHLNEPDRVSKYVAPFLLKSDDKINLGKSKL